MTAITVCKGNSRKLVTPQKDAVAVIPAAKSKSKERKHLANLEWVLYLPIYCGTARFLYATASVMADSWV